MNLFQSCGHSEFSKFAGVLSATLSQHHLLGFEIAQLEYHHFHHYDDKKKKKTVIRFYLNLFPRNMFWILSGTAKMKGIAFDPVPFHFIEPSSVLCICGLWKWQKDIFFTVLHIIPVLYVWRFLSVYKWNLRSLSTLNKTWRGEVGSWSSLAYLYGLSSPPFISLHSGAYFALSK